MSAFQVIAIVTLAAVSASALSVVVVVVAASFNFRARERIEGKRVLCCSQQAAEVDAQFATFRALAAGVSASAWLATTNESALACELLCEFVPKATVVRLSKGTVCSCGVDGMIDTAHTHKVFT